MSDPTEGWSPYSAALALHVAAEAAERAAVGITSGEQATNELLTAVGTINNVAQWLLSGKMRQAEFGVDR